MQNIQEIFVRAQTMKKSIKDIRSGYKDALLNTPRYKELTDELKTLREKKKHMETTVKEYMAGDFTKLEDLQIDLASDQELLNDIAISMVMKGESIKVTDEHDEEYEPVFAVKFKKVT